MCGERRRQVRGVVLLAMGAALLVVAACQLVAGISTRTLDPIHGGCALPSGSGPQARIANLVPSADVVDVCIRPAGGSWGEPLILNGGTDCASSSFFNADGGANTGFAYGDISVAFAAPAAKVDVKMIAAGGTCSSAALTEGDGLTLATNTSTVVTTLARVGGNGVKEELVALPEDDSNNPSSTRVRFVHAMPGLGPLDFGGANGMALPTTLGQPFVSKPVPFGAAPAQGEMGQEGPITDHGYDNIAPVGGFTVVAAVHGQNPEKALLLWSPQMLNGTTVSLYAIGVARSTEYPQRGLVCQENPTTLSSGNPLLISCTLTSLPSISVDVLNTGLYGENSPNFDARDRTWQNPKLNPYVTQRDTDVVCLIELDFPLDITPLTTAVGPVDAGGNGQFPYSYWFDKASITTPPTDPADLSGNTPPSMLATPPCAAGNADQTLVTEVLQCFEKYCDSVPDSGSGVLPKSTDCLSEHCYLGGPLATLLAKSPGCVSCLTDYIGTGGTYSTAQNACATSLQPPFGFNGQVPVVILSRYPLSDTDTFILPSTNFRQAISYARVQLEDTSFDFYCGFFSSTLVASTVPYPPWGFYGGDGSPGDPNENGAYAQEQLLQAKDMIKWVAKKSAGRPAIIAGDWRSGLGVNGDGGVPPPDSGLFAPPTGLVTTTMQALTAAFTPVMAPGWSPQCNYCPQSENVLNSGTTVGYFVEQPFLANWGSSPQSATIDQSLLFTQSNVDQGNGTIGPLSPYYGLNFHVQRLTQ